MRTNVSDEWGGFGLYRSRADAEEVLENPGDHLPFLKDCVEAFWRDDAAMMQAAYKPGDHRSEMDYYREVGLLDRSSFNRARILAGKGTWDGSDPVLEMS